MARTSTIHIRHGRRGTTIRATGGAAQALCDAIVGSAINVQQQVDPWPLGATVKLRWIGPGRCSSEPGWGIRGPDGELLSLHGECALDLALWSIVEERGA